MCNIFKTSFVMLLFILLLTANSNLIHATDRSSSSDTTLSRQQVQTLSNRDFLSDGLKLDVLSGIINNEKKTVILTGEVHFKTETLSQNARKIVEQFKFYGIEGVDIDNYWGGGGLKLLITTYYSLLGKFFEQTTINEAYEQEITGLAKVRLCKTIEKTYRQGGFQNYQELYDFNLSLGKTRFPDPVIEEVYQVVANEENCVQSFEKTIYLGRV